MLCPCALEKAQCSDAPHIITNEGAIGVGINLARCRKFAAMQLVVAPAKRGFLDVAQRQMLGFKELQAGYYLPECSGLVSAYDVLEEGQKQTREFASPTKRLRRGLYKMSSRTMACHCMTLPSSWRISFPCGKNQTERRCRVEGATSLWEPFEIGVWGLLVQVALTVRGLLPL